MSERQQPGDAGRPDGPKRSKPQQNKQSQGGKPRGGRPPRPARRDPVRALAYEALRAVDERDAYANLALPALLRDAELERRDAALATELVYGTLRNQGTYDAVLAECVDRPLREVDKPVLDVLCLGAHQLLNTRIPGHAAVSATVELARSVLGDGRAKFVNAVLRRITRHDLDGWLARVAPDPEEDPEGNLAVLHSHPDWVVSALWDALAAWQPGTEAADVAELLAADNARPEVTLVTRPGRSTVAELIDELPEDSGGTPGSWSRYAVRMHDGGDPARLDAVAEDRAGVQDEGSQLVAAALADAPLHGDTDRYWLDGCAGPGGKAALLAGLATARDARLLAVERQPHRAALVDRALAGDPGAHQTVTADATRPAWRAGSFDRVLMDVPCSGLGALRRRPEARWRRQPEDISNFAPLQRELLRNALTAVRVGGVVGYVTCSPHLAETRSVVRDVLRHAGAPTGPATGWSAEQVDARPLLDGLPHLGDGPDVQLWPHLHGTDAMYLALLRRTS